MKKIFCILVLVAMVTSPAVLADEDGGYAGALLQLSVQARPAAMGGAFYGLSDDGSAQYFNPAGLSQITQKTFSSSYRIMTLDRKLGYVSMVLPTHLESALGISWLYAGYGEVTARNASGRELDRTISSEEHLFSVTFAKRFVPYFSVGTKLGYYYKKLANLDANSIGVDFGGMLFVDSLMEYGYMEDKPVQDITVGLIVHNLAATYPWTTNDYWEKYTDNPGVTQNDKFPVLVGLGVSFKTFNRKLLTVFDVEKNTKQTAKVKFGGEYTVDKLLRLRAGLNQGHVTAGMGLSQQINNFMLMFDYAFSAEKADEGSDHIISLNLVF